MRAAAFILDDERPADWWEVEALYDLCFAPGREALSSYRLREGVAPVPGLCRVARDGEGILAGAIRVWPVRVGPMQAGPMQSGPMQSGPTQVWPVPAILIGPIAVHPTRQGEGLGALLIRDCLTRARDLGWQRAILVGDAPYYGRFGFARLDGVEMPPPTNPDRVLGVALRPGAWDGVRGRVARPEPE